jgi:hypothetical protein
VAANQFLTPSAITFNALEILENELVVTSKINREYDDKFAQQGAKIGATLNVRKPARYTVGSGPVIDPQPITETYIPVTITDQLHVPVQISAVDMALSMDDFRARVLKPAMAALANQIDLLAIQRLTAATYNCVGTAGQLQAGTATSAQAIAAVMAAGQRLDDEAAPMDADRYGIIGTATNTGLVQAHSTLFNPSSVIGEQFKKGAVGSGILGFDFYRSQNITNFTASSLAAAKTNTVNGAQGASNAVQTDASTTFTLTVNDIGAAIPAGTSVTFSDVYAVNPQSRVPTLALKNFVVTEAYASGGTTLKIYPYPIFSGPFQNVYATGGAIPNNATLSLLNGYGSAITQQNLMFHRNAYTLACADLPLPSGNGKASRAQSKAGGLAIRFVENWYDVMTDQFVSRFDVLFGVKAVYPELATKLNG